MPLRLTPIEFSSAVSAKHNEVVSVTKALAADDGSVFSIADFVAALVALATRDRARFHCVTIDRRSYTRRYVGVAFLGQLDMRVNCLILKRIIPPPSVHQADS